MQLKQNTMKDDVHAAGSDQDEQIKAELVKKYIQQLQKEVAQGRLQQVTNSLLQNIQDLLAASLDKFQTGGSALVERISRPVKRRGDLSDILKERASDLTQDLAERGQVLAEYRDDLSHQLRKRGRRVRRTLQKQNRKLQKSLQKQFQQQQKRIFWIAAGCAFGLTLAGIISYQFLHRRSQQLKEEEAILELPIDTQNGNVNNVMPANAAFVGISSTKLYYPIETPLDQLLTRDNRLADTVYFASEQEASKEGFQPAQAY